MARVLFTPEEDQIILNAVQSGLYRSKTAAFKELSESLDRSIASISNRYYSIWKVCNHQEPKQKPTTKKPFTIKLGKYIITILKKHNYEL